MSAPDDLHGHSVADDAFYEWLLSDHPDARAERDYRRATAYQEQRERTAQVLAWADKINAAPDAPRTLRDLAESMGPLAARAAARVETEAAEPDDAYVARLRADWETCMQVSGQPGAWDYRYPARLTGPGAASYPPPPEPEAGGTELGSLRTVANMTGCDGSKTAFDFRCSP